MEVLVLGEIASFSRYYERLIRDRQPGVPDEITPPDHTVAWSDAPSKFTIIRDVPRVPLPSGLTSAGLGEGIGCKDYCLLPPPPGITLDVVSDLLLLGAGILGRRVDINWNGQSPESSHHLKALYSRGAASGGGLYPTEAYLIAEKVEGLARGVYHYDAAHHALARLRAGGFRPVLEEACLHSSVASADFLLVVTVRFWKNLFKYYNFAFQVVTQDAGCLADCFQQAAWRLGISTTTLYWFRDEVCARLLGLEGSEEAVCAVIAARGAERHSPAQDQDSKPVPFPLPELHLRRYERSRRVFFPALLGELHRETTAGGDRRPRADSLPEWEAGGAGQVASFPLEQGCRMAKGFAQSLMERATSWGRFRLYPPLSGKELSSLLCFVNCSARHATDIYSSPRGPSAVRLGLIARYVSDLPPGVYDQDPHQGQLILRTGGRTDAQLQKAYFLENYNLDQVAAILVVIARLEAVWTAWGGRGLRIMNAEAGMVAERCYVAASALGLGCGAALGLDATRINRVLGIDGEKESSILLIFIGHQAPSAYAYDFRFRN